MHSIARERIRSFVVFSAILAFVAASSACLSLRGRRSADSAQKIAEAASPETGASASPTAVASSEQGAMLSIVFADGPAERLEALRALCRRQAQMLDSQPRSPMEAAAQQWLEEFFDPQDETSRSRTALGPRSGVADLHHHPGYEFYVETGGGILVFSREGTLLGKIGQGGERLADLAFHDVDGDGQSEVFFKFDSGGNSGNRFTRILGFKEVGGSVEQVLDRKLYETAWRWVSAGLGSRLTLVRLAGSSYVVIDPEGEAEFLRWDPGMARFVRENGPPRRAFLE